LQPLLLVGRKPQHVLRREYTFPEHWPAPCGAVVEVVLVRWVEGVSPLRIPDATST
jgi:hypothetical protein